MLTLKQKIKLIIAYENISDASIIKELKISPETFYRILRDRNIPVGKRGKDFIKILNEKSQKTANKFKSEDLIITANDFYEIAIT